MTQGTLLTAASAALLILSAGQARSQETAQEADPPLPILIQGDDLYLLQLGIGVSVEVVCREATWQETPDGVADLGPCGKLEGETRVHRLLDELQVTGDLAAEMKNRLEQALRERIAERIRRRVEDGIARRLPVRGEDP